MHYQPELSLVEATSLIRFQRLPLSPLSTPTLILQLQLCLALLYWTPTLKIQGALSASDFPCVCESIHWFLAHWSVHVHMLSNHVWLLANCLNTLVKLLVKKLVSSAVGQLNHSSKNVVMITEVVNYIPQKVPSVMKASVTVLTQSL